MILPGNLNYMDDVLLEHGGFHCQASQRVKAIHFQPGAIGSGHLRLFFYFVASLGV